MRQSLSQQGRRWPSDETLRKTLPASDVEDYVLKNHQLIFCLEHTGADVRADRSTRALRYGHFVMPGDIDNTGAMPRDELERTYSSLGNLYLAQRETDVRDIANDILTAPPVKIYSRSTERTEELISAFEGPVESVADSEDSTTANLSTLGEQIASITNLARDGVLITIDALAEYLNRTPEEIATAYDTLSAPQRGVIARETGAAPRDGQTLVETGEDLIAALDGDMESEE